MKKILAALTVTFTISPVFYPPNFEEVALATGSFHSLGIQTITVTATVVSSDTYKGDAR